MINVLKSNLEQILDFRSHFWVKRTSQDTFPGKNLVLGISQPFQINQPGGQFFSQEPRFLNLIFGQSSASGASPPCWYQCYPRVSIWQCVSFTSVSQRSAIEKS